MDARGWTPKQALLEFEGWRAGGRRLRKSGSPDLRRARIRNPGAPEPRCHPPLSQRFTGQSPRRSQIDGPIPVARGFRTC